MRKLENEMLAALRAGRAWQSGNTSVTAPNSTGRAAVYLHGNHIADWRNGRAEPNLSTLALGVNIYQRKGCIYANGVAVAP